MEKIIVIVTAVIIILIIILASYYWNKKCFLSVYYNKRYGNGSHDNSHYGGIDYGSTDYDNTRNNMFYIMPISYGYVRVYFFIGIAGIIIWGTISTLCLIFFDTFAFWIFYCFVLLSVYLCIDVSLEKYVITLDSLIHYIPLLPPKETKINEITTVKYTDNKTNNYHTDRKVLVGYHDRKKLFSINESVDGFDLLLSLFFQNGKLETEHRPVLEHFSVAGKKSDIIGAVLGFPIVFAIWVYAICVNDLEWILIIMSAPFVPLYISYMLDNLLLKVTVDSHTMSVRNSFGIVKTYDISQITEIQERKNHIVLFSGKEKIIRLPKDYVNFDLFLKWLSQNRWHEGGIDIG